MSKMKKRTNPYFGSVIRTRDCTFDNHNGKGCIIQNFAIIVCDRFFFLSFAVIAFFQI